MNEFKRKQWTRIGLSLIAVAAAVLFLTGAIGGEAMTYRIGQNAEGASQDYAYTAEKETNFSVIRVSANAEDGKITECAITSEEKSEGSDFLTDEIRKSWAEAIVEHQTADTDVITGATLQFSAAAVREAAAEILSQVKGGAAEETAEAAPAEAAESAETAEAAPAEAAEPAEEASPEEEAKPEEEARPEEAAEAKTFAYTAEKETDFSIIRVSANAEDGKITECAITSEEKSKGTDFLTDAVREAWAKAIMENQTADTDVITGASLKFSAAAVQEATAEILAQIQGGTAEAAPAEAAEEAGPEEEAGPAEAEKPAEEAADAEGEYGSFLSEKETDYSVISVFVSTKNGKITKCSITSEEKSKGTDFLTDAVREAWAKAIVENQTADTDVITGATLKYSSAAVQEAVAEILAQLRGGAAEAAPAEAAKPEAEAGPAEAEKPAEETADAEGEYASYLSEKETDYSVISVYINIREGKITKCRIESEEKSKGTDFLTDAIREAWAEAIVENQTADTDVITGATLKYSSAAVKEAVEEILENAGK